MKAYVALTGIIFGLLTILHIWRAIVERQVMTQPWFMLITVLPAALCVWSVRLLWRWPKN
jgi:tetrahydromethanopterin S-methyltransferase subunit E